ncbi:MAG TPA: GatB/YqeY domain-containing protein [Syntrophales bacterium]|nr:GatB/YqeY domain-containing protein [Syntrophales bacterium]HOL58354.1 GatB/YqeY domain-containing protein [Syntrophales bacterium]HPO34523.1 GatB/YqeY domain-containing protein [Syntrophales bacterium]
MAENYQERIERESIAAAKAKDKVRLSALRMLKTAVHNKEIDLKRALTEAEFLQVVSSMVKQRRESIEQFEKGDRMDLVEKEKAELAIIQEFLPQPLSEEELAALIDKVIAETNATGPKDVGKVMKALMPLISGRADGKEASEKVRQRLSTLG